ncbi:uncharacterized protein N7483_011875 [Penicillium malachiteum]|uniref:uncharacterized protein n=1 Tax=Penicillium malachiteum TaxID=1324776 RepID=UPI002548671B|nr:uncharacterized protein N7483_011875 [Penicillium malachiteum]KAJ5714694.1 hypothetical protein N7483_011875 [Penicillium malachiteum]
MEESSHVREAFHKASVFLSPVLDKGMEILIERSRGTSLLRSLSQKTEAPQGDDETSRTAVIGKALEILNDIHDAFVTPIESSEKYKNVAVEGRDPALEDAKRRRMLHALLDLISLEGIYPSLSSGVGIPLQQRVISVLPAGVIAKQTAVHTSILHRNMSLLRHIVEALLNILLDPRPSIQPVIRGRILSDVISGTADLAFNKNIKGYDGQRKLQAQFVNIINDTPSAVLLPTLSAFLQTDTTPWFKSTVSSQIAQVPLRPGGVLQTIMFLASQFAPSLGQEAQSEPSNGPHFTVQAIMQISKLLSSVPQHVEPSVYLTTIAPQLLTLLDGDDPDLKRTVSYTIGNGILGKRALGARGMIGHTIFVEPLFRTLTADLDESSMRWMMQYPGFEKTKSSTPKSASLSKVVVNHEMIDLAIERLGSLALQHPNPGLVKRIVTPILLPLWGLACFTKEQDSKVLHEKVMALLQTFFSISVGVPPLKKLVDNLLWDGGSAWTYSSSSDGHISLVKRIHEGNEHLNMVRLIDSLQVRTELFASLLAADPSCEESTGEVFLYVSQKWLVQPSPEDKPQQLGESETIFQRLISAKVAEKLLDSFKNTLSRHPLRVLDLIKQVIDGELHNLGAKSTSQSQASGKPSLSSLANIVTSENTADQDESNKDTSESLSTAFSLLSTVLASPEFSISEMIKSLLESIKEKLDRLIPLLPPALSKPATTSSMLLEIQLTSQEHDDTKPPPPHIADLETHRQALSNLNSNLPPVQAEGFSLLTQLIINSSPVLDIPSTLTLLLSIINDISESTANEEFIYLNAIKLIGTLASRHPRTVVKTLVDSYTDKSEQRTLDQRLKIGESLLRTVQDLGEALTGEIAKILGEAMVTVAGRRGNKPQAQRTRKKQEEKERRQEEREERKRQKEAAMSGGWKVTTGPTDSKDEVTLADSDSESESPEQSIHAANIVAAWAAGAASDEEPDDLRVRASALSILASAITTNVRGLGPAVISSAVDLALATLTLEPAAESAILRRASAVLILDILRALDKIGEEQKTANIGFGFSLIDDGKGGNGNGMQSSGSSTIGNIPSMLRTLGFVESREEDVIVRGHLRVLIESLEAWLEKALMWGIEGLDGEPRMELGDRIAGLDIDPLAGRGPLRPRIEEIE